MTPEQIKEKIKAAKAKVAEVEARRESAYDEFNLKEELRLAEQDAHDVVEIEKLEKEHGIANIKVVRTLLGAIVVTPPNNVLWKRIQDKPKDKDGNPDISHEDIELLVRKCVVYPDQSRFSHMTDERVGILNQCTEAVLDLGNAKREVRSKK